MCLPVVVRLTPTSRAFEIFILTTIFANCIALAVSTPYPGNDSDEVNKVLVGFHYFYTTVFRRRSSGLCAAYGD